MIIKDVSVDDCHDHIRGLCTVRKKIRDIEGGREMRTVHIYHAKVGALTYLYRSRIRAPDCAGRIDSGHVQHVTSLKHRRILRDSLMDKRGKMHLLEHVEIVVRCASVRSESDVDPGSLGGGDPGESASKLHVARRIVHERYAAFAHDAEIVIRSPHAMGCIRAVLQYAGVGKIRDRSLPVTGDALLVFTTRF